MTEGVFRKPPAGPPVGPPVGPRSAIGDVIDAAADAAADTAADGTAEVLRRHNVSCAPLAVGSGGARRRAFPGTTLLEVFLTRQCTVSTV
ncbi:hypothetical protein [Haloactinomyces albus]|uniref:Uncharacterized protein n=1 Tax=Haloactinomyces albus TaxID=1352928 RepID=A0AAE3ZDV3_9ACTN|nr:hypothetical protein [Haloactinomyces albus]MDR7303107.1 hypothetical protein [Haloactinomyces albus]